MSGPRQESFRLKLEALEDRTLPATTLGGPIVTPGAAETPAAVATGDFTGDGASDLVTANLVTNDVSVLPGDGQGHFGAPRSSPAGISPSAVVVGDFRAVGKLDVAVLTREGVDVLLGNGDGTFAPPKPVATLNGNQINEAGDAFALVVGDFNGDGKRDLAVITALSTVTVLLSNGDGSFTAAPTVQVNFTFLPLGLATGDLNRDGHGDLIVAGIQNPCGAAKPGQCSQTFLALVFLGKGDGTFTQFGSGLGAAGNPLLGDFRGTGKPDLVVGGQFFPGNGDGTFGTPITLSANPVLTGDWNGDGKPDLVAVSPPATFSASGPATGLDLLPGNGDGTFAPAKHAALDFSPGPVAAADFNGDGKLDLATPSLDSATINLDLLLLNGSSFLNSGVTLGSKSLSVLLGNGDGSFAGPTTWGVGTTPTALAPADFNGDGKTDLALTDRGTNSVSVLPGSGDGSFGKASSLAVGQNPRAVVASDLQGDGKADLAVVNFTSNTVSVLLGNGDGSFATAVNYAVGTHPDALAAGDFNGDGKPDLAAANYADNTVSVLLGNGDATFRAPTNVGVGTGPTSLVVADFNGDGKADLATGDSASLSVLLGNGDGTFAAATHTALGFFGIPPLALVTADFNADGKPDLAASSAEGVSVLPGKGDGTFDTVTSYGVPGSGFQSSLAVGDFNGDGVLDLANGKALSGDLYLLPGNGDGTFRSPTPAGPSVLHVDQLAVADVTGDGRPDLIFVDETNSNLAVMPARLESLNRGFVSRLYHDLLRREADAAGLNLFSGQLDNGTATRVQVIQQIQASPEYRAQVIARIINKLLAHPAGPLDASFWLNFLNAGGTLSQMQAILVGSEEYFASRGAGDSVAFLTAAFRDLLGRDPSPAEVQGFTPLLGSSAGRTQVALALLASPGTAAVTVRQLFQTYLGRAADATGLAFFTSALQMGATSDQVVALLVSSAEYFAAANAGVSQAYVTQLYRDLLGRPAAAADLGYWKGLLDSGQLTPQQVVQQIEASAEYRTHVVQQAYQTFLHRPADDQGLAFFVAGLGAGGTLQQVDAVLAGSDEYFQKRGGGSADGVVKALYQDVLGREADAAGLGVFTQALGQGAKPADVAAALFGSDEYRQDLVQQLYQEDLHRAVDAAGLGFWTAVLKQGGSAEQVRTALLSSDEYFARLP